MRYIVALLAALTLCCSSRTTGRLDQPPEPTPYCVPNYSCSSSPPECCEFEEDCCDPTALCRGAECVPSRDLVVPDAGCVSQQADIAIVIDLSASMSPWIEDTLDQLDRALALIPATTTIQVWVTPPSFRREGEFLQIQPPGTPAEARTALAGLGEDGTGGGLEATIDVTVELLRNNSHWRFGTTVRGIFVVSDEPPHSYTSPVNTLDAVCDATLPLDRVVVFTKALWAPLWARCYETFSLNALDTVLPYLLVDPCTMVEL